MRILHIITGLSDGGAEAVLHRLCSTSKTHQHLVISLMDAGKYGSPLRQTGVAVHTLDMPRGRISWRGLFRLWRLLRRERPDLVQTWMYHADLVGGLAARLSGVRAVCWGVHHTTLQPFEDKHSTILVARLCARLSHWVPSRIVCCARQSVVAHQALGYDVSRCVVVPNGYDVSYFRPAPEARQRVREALGLAADCPVIGLVGRFHPQKDHPNLLAALARVRAAGWAVETLLVGTGLESENAVLTESVVKAGLASSVRLLGPSDDIPAIMNALDLHVLSSARGEAFPNVLAEAMSCGTPCVTTNVGDAALIVGDTGWVVPPADASALAQAIIEALDGLRDARQWAARQMAARARIQEHFSLERIAKAYDDVWMEAYSATRPHVGKA